VCTASWLILPEGFELFFNRDESVRRGLARAPEPLDVEGVRALAPVDADAGGTWLGVNEHGLALGLLNAWDARTPEAPRSRGLLVRELLAARTLAEALERLARTPLERFRGFTLALVAPGAPLETRAWDGERLAPATPRAPLSSSSYDRVEAARARAALFERRVAADGLVRATLEGFHASHEPERGPLSPCMHRADAATVSSSQVRVDARQVSMRYAPGPPCVTAFGPWLSLERTR